jgi:fatty acid desaturase
MNNIEDRPRLLETELLKLLSRRSDRAGALQVAAYCSSWIGSGVLLAFTWGSFVALPIFVIHGILLNCLYAGQHELSHWTVFKTRHHNDHVGRVFGFLTFNPFMADRWHHFTHHRFTQDPQRDADLVGGKPYTLTSYILDLSGLSFWIRRARSIVATALDLELDQAVWLSEQQRADIVQEARLHLLGYGIIAALSFAFGTAAALQLWLAPLLATKWFHQLQNTGEHVGLTHEQDTLINTRTLEGPAIMRWLMWNMSYHTAHHTFPGVPFYNLPRLHGEIEKRLGRKLPTAGYLEAQVEIFRGLLRRPERQAPAE